MDAEAREELTDVVLCYQAMGVPLDADPVQIEQVYRTLTDGYRKDLSAAGQVQREEARRNLALVQEMYDKIRVSITYHAVEKEYQRRAERSAETTRVKRQPHSAVVERNRQIHCARCNGLIARGLKTCPICKGAVLSPLKRIFKACFTPKKLLLYFVVLAVASVVALRLLRPELFSGNQLDSDPIEQMNK